MANKKSADEIDFLEELGLPLSTGQKRSQNLEGVLARIRVSKSNRSKKAVFVTHKDGDKPIQLGGRENTIDFFKSEVAKGSMGGLVVDLKTQGFFVTAYAGGYLVRLHDDD